MVVLLEALQNILWEGDGNQEISTRSWVSLATFWEDGMVFPEALAGAYLPVLLGICDLDDGPNYG